MTEFSANPAACLTDKVATSAALRPSRFLPRYVARQYMGRQHIVRRAHHDIRDHRYHVAEFAAFAPQAPHPALQGG
ncbi:hypothetical protein [Sphingopyxis sp. KK2]|uniref:hypothetical protein n=1 Tax=Sphingopyxis sp. KK2 TaxID=1855727 RepID=UPI0011818145|nr:hypothetical protein [Sphingopyxis sp. KK2]